MTNVPNIAAMTPFRYDRKAGQVVGVNQKVGGDALALDVRGWGYLTGKGHGALGLDQEIAAREQDAFGELVAELLTKHFGNS